MKIKKLSILLASALSLSTLVSACGSKNASISSASSLSSSGKIILKLGHTLSPQSHYQLTALEFARLVKQKTNDKVEIQIFPQSQLGGEVQMTQALKTGTQDLDISAQAPMTSSVKEWGIFDLPYLFDNLDQANKVLQGPVGQKYLDMLDKQNIVGLTWITAIERDVFTSKKPVKTIDDMKNLKLRVMQSPGYVNGYKALGANPTPLAYNELYLALQQGVVDGGDTSPDQLVQDKFTEVSKYYSLTHVNYLPVVIAMSKLSLNKLSPDQQKAIKEAAKEAAQYDLKIYKEQYDKAIQDMKAKGIQVLQVDTNPWMQATDKARQDLLSNIPSGQQLYQEIQNAKK